MPKPEIAEVCCDLGYCWLIQQASSNSILRSLVKKYFSRDCFARGQVVSVMVKMSVVRLSSRGFDSRLSHFQLATLGKLFAHMCLCHQAVSVQVKKWRRPAAAGKATVGLASHWPRVILSGLSTYRLTAYVREMTTPPILLTLHTLPFACRAPRRPLRPVPPPGGGGATAPCFRQCCGRGVLHGVVVSGEVPVAAQL